MGGQTALTVLLVLLGASIGWTQTIYSSGPGNDTKDYNCTTREGTSLTVLVDELFASLYLSQYMEQILSHVSARFPCLTRQYASILLDYNETKTIYTSDKEVFLKSIAGYKSDNQSVPVESINRLLKCKQSLLHGLKRALEISPAESVIIVVTSGSMVDYNDTQLLSDVYTLVDKKKSQIHFLWRSGYCSMDSSQQDIFNDLAFSSFGEFGSWSYISDYRVTNSMSLLLSKPLNTSVRVLGLKMNVTDEYTKTFNITDNLRYLVIAGVNTFSLNFTNPNGDTLLFEKLPTGRYQKDFVNYHLVKNPEMGTWTLNVQGNESLNVHILGFIGLNSSGICSDSDCHPNATCGEFGGAQECTCKEGFAGDGYNCEDIDECQDFNSNCHHYGSGFCVNTIGSYTCKCRGGNVHIKERGCVDVDECADSSLNDCHPLAVCFNHHYYGYYTCSCPYGYYGDGRYCEVNECQQGSPCGSDECIKYNGSYACVDPCSNYTVLNDSWRSTSNLHTSYDYYYYYNNWAHCDSSLSNGWYRFKGESDHQMPEYCVPSYSCGTFASFWLYGSHPTIEDGIVSRSACGHWNDDCCYWYNMISVRQCNEGYYVYKLKGTENCNSAYCIDSEYSCSDLNCAPDEDCVQECYCKNAYYVRDWKQPENLAELITPKVTCGLDDIKVTFSKCLLENLGYNTSSIHLRDDYCQVVHSKRDKAYITFVTQPKNGSCGGNILSNQNTITYKNTIYLTPRTDLKSERREYDINFYCSYPLSLDINLIAPDDPFTDSHSINVVGKSNFTITMGLFQDSGYTNSYSGSELWFNSSSMLYVGVIATGSSGASPFVLLLKNCYTTPTANDTYGMRYIIQDRCPNKNDPTISMPENGVSLTGRFAFHVFRFLGELGQVYLHCEIGLCDTSSSDCSAGCSLMRSVDLTAGASQTISLGPIKYKDTQIPDDMTK